MNIHHCTGRAKAVDLRDFCDSEHKRFPGPVTHDLLTKGQ
jgi:hypothetical protein